MNIAKQYLREQKIFIWKCLSTGDSFWLGMLGSGTDVWKLVLMHLKDFVE